MSIQNTFTSLSFNCSLAEALHRAHMYQQKLEDDIFNRLGIIFDIKIDKFGCVDIYPCEDITYDAYDNSLELIDCAEDVKLTKEKLDKILELGYSRVWLNWKDNTEQYGDNEGHITKRKKKR